MNSLLQYRYISKLFTFKADSQYLLKAFRKKNSGLKKPWMKFQSNVDNNIARLQEFFSLLSQGVIKT